MTERISKGVELRCQKCGFSIRYTFSESSAGVFAEMINTKIAMPCPRCGGIGQYDEWSISTFDIELDFEPIQSGNPEGEVSDN